MDKITPDINNDLSQNVRHERGSFPVQVLWDDAKTCQSSDYPYHWHYEMEISVVERGSVIYAINGKCYSVWERQAIFVKPNALHSTIHSDEYISRILLISPHVFGDHEEYISRYIKKLIRLAPDAVVLDGSANWHEEACALIENAFWLCHERPEAYELDALISLFRILKLFVRELCGNQEETARNPRNASHTKILKQMITFVQEHYGDDIDISDISRAGGVSRSSCNKIYQEFLGESPIEYLTKFRIYASMELLRKNMTVTEAALSCGFNTLAYYSKIFKKVTGRTPLEFRKNG